MKRFLILALTGIVALVIQSYSLEVVQAIETPVIHSLRDCSLTPRIECVKSITAVDASGRRILGELTGRTSDNKSYVGEYEFPGLKFEGSSGNRILPVINYNPFGSRGCYNPTATTTLCYDAGEIIMTTIQPTNYDMTDKEKIALTLSLPFRPSAMVCGSWEFPAPCVREFNFDIPVKFEISLRVPSQFHVVFSSGQVTGFSLQEGLDPETIDGIDYTTLKYSFSPLKKNAITRSPIIKGDFYTPPLYADYRSDRVELMFRGKNDNGYPSLARCAGAGDFSVFSNATDQGAPVWDSRTQQLSIETSGSHFTPEGTVTAGFFQATISRGIAKCLWDLDLGTKTSAQVNITYDNAGTPQAETISSNFDGRNFIITDSNFHFSVPKFSIKLSNETSPTATPTIIPTASSTPKSKITISCVKGTQTKKISAVKPKCPKGYIKK